MDTSSPTRRSRLITTFRSCEEKRRRGEAPEPCNSYLLVLPLCTSPTPLSTEIAHHSPTSDQNVFHLQTVDYTKSRMKEHLTQQGKRGKDNFV
jgi:hypothetical protein